MSIKNEGKGVQKIENPLEQINEVDPFEEVIIAAWRSRSLLSGALPLVKRDRIITDITEGNASNAVVTAIQEIENGMIDLNAAREEIIKINQSYSAPKNILRAAMESSINAKSKDGKKPDGTRDNSQHVDEELFNVFMEAFNEETEVETDIKYQEDYESAEDLKDEDNEIRQKKEITEIINSTYEDEEEEM